MKRLESLRTLPFTAAVAAAQAAAVSASSDELHYPASNCHPE